MSEVKLSINNLLHDVADFYETVDRSKEFIANNTRFGFIARDYIPFAQQKNLEFAWMERFNVSMPLGLFNSANPHIIKIIKVTNALIHDTVPKRKEQEWVVPHFISRATKYGLMSLHAAPQNEDDLMIESKYILASDTPRFATDEEVELFNAELTARTKQHKFNVQMHVFSFVIKVGTISEIEEAWASLETQ
jgi:hypothetical protein